MINLIIADNDEFYIQGMYSYIRRKYKDKFNVSSFSSNEDLVDFINNLQIEIDIILATEEIYQEVLANIKNNFFKQIILLTDGSSQYEKLPYINKYQSIEVILSKAIEIVSANNSNLKVIKGEKQTKVISFYSPIGGSGKSLLSAVVSANLSKTGKRVFYLNLEKHSSINAFFKINKREGISELLYYFKSNISNIQLKMELLKQNDSIYGVDYFAPLHCALDVDNSFNELEKIPEEIIISGNYDYLIIDTDSSMINYTSSLFEISSSIIVPFTYDRISCIKIENMLYQLSKFKENKGINIIDKLIFIPNKILSNNALNEESTKILNCFSKYSINVIEPIKYYNGNTCQEMFNCLCKNIYLSENFLNVI